MDLALFDFDGTLSRCETFPKFVPRVVPEWRRRAARWRLAPWVIGYRLGLVSGTRVRAAVVRVGLAGVPEADFVAAAQAFARDDLPALLRPEALARLRAHRARGDRVVVVSGNFDALLRPWCEAEGVELLASQLESRDGALTGNYDGPQCVLDQKVARVRALLSPGDFARVHAYGDTPEDRPMLALSATPMCLAGGWPAEVDPQRID